MTGSTQRIAPLAQSEERKTFNLKVAGSIPARGVFLLMRALVRLFLRSRKRAINRVTRRVAMRSDGTSRRQGVAEAKLLLYCISIYPDLSLFGICRLLLVGSILYLE